ncbi:MAG: hypothetical protein ABL888_11345 [Pirellulaceae bacterium]
MNQARSGRFDSSGAFVLSFSTPAISAEEFLENEIVLDELSATDEQKEKLKTVSEKWNAKRKELSRDPNFNPDKLEPGRIEYWQSVDQILLKHQQTALAQLQFRHFLRSTGVKRFFLEAPQVKEFLNFEKKICETISRKRQENRTFVRERAVAARTQSVDTLLAQFDEKEQSIILGKWPGLIAKDSGMTEKFRVQLQTIEEPEFIKDIKSNLAKNSKFQFFKINAGGELVPNPIINQNIDENRILRIKVFMLFQPQLTPDAELSRIIAEAGLSDVQIQELRAANEEYIQRSNEIIKKSGFGNEMDKQLKVFGEKANASVVRILTPQQVQYFDQHAATVLEQKLGPVYDILYGRTGVELKLSDKDKERFKKAVEKATQKIEQATVEIETELLMRLFEPLSDDQKQRLDELLGPVPEDIAVGLSVYEDK